LHDIGRPVVLQAVVQILNEQKLRVSPSGVMLATTEQHCAIGGDLAEAWSLPEPVQAAIRHHHAAAPPNAHAASVLVTALADELARHTFEPERMPEEQLRTHPALAPLGLATESLDKLLAKSESIRQTALVLS
jgi:HD-like signal output (HDOD) protein